MPNWCNNTVTIQHNDPAKIAALSEAIQNGDFCKFVKPIPEALKDTTAPNSDANAKALIEEYGYSDWYDYCVNEWGTKWDVSDEGGLDIDGDTITFSFDSAWAPPIGIYEQLAADGYEVDAMYHEPGMCFVGRFIGGEDFCIGYEDESSDTVREAIGEELDDYYGISEQLAEYEDEE